MAGQLPSLLAAPYPSLRIRKGTRTRPERRTLLTRPSQNQGTVQRRLGQALWPMLSFPPDTCRHRPATDEPPDEPLVLLASLQSNDAGPFPEQTRWHSQSETHLTGFPSVCAHWLVLCWWRSTAFPLLRSPPICAPAICPNRRGSAQHSCCWQRSSKQHESARATTRFSEAGIRFCATT